jgi:signal transduction histidine kinase
VRDALTMASLFAVALESHTLDERLYSLSRVLLSGQLAAGFGHEVYNGVSGLDLQFRNVRSDLDRLAQAVPGLSEHAEFQEARQDLDKATETAMNLTRIVEEFRKLMRTEEGQEVDVNQIVRQAVAQVRPQANKAKVKLHLNLAANLPMAAGGDIRLQQVFLNLMLNAVQQIESKADGRRALAVSTVCHDDKGQWVEIRFSDTGPGIHQQILRKIFDLGFTTRTGGSGLGLYIARSLIESMGGQIMVEKSLVPIGATFLVSLRVAGPAGARSITP